MENGTRRASKTSEQNQADENRSVSATNTNAPPIDSITFYNRCCPPRLTLHACISGSGIKGEGGGALLHSDGSGQISRAKVLSAKHPSLSLSLSLPLSLSSPLDVLVSLTDFDGEFVWGVFFFFLGGVFFSSVLGVLAPALSEQRFEEIRRGTKCISTLYLFSEFHSR
jgi:hypothetical protein